MARVRAVGVVLAESGAAGFAALFAFFMAVRWPFRADYLVNWDAVQFALAVDEFRIEAHQPHPPGYIGYVALARALSAVIHDVPQALTAISVIASAVAPAALFLLARRMMPARYALASAVLFGFSPLLWYYGNVALTYAPEVALVLLFAWSAHRAMSGGRVGDLLLAAALLAVLGAVRQSAMVLTGGMWLVAIAAFPWRVRILATGALGLAVAAWAIPLLWLAGGLEAYLSESAALAEAAGSRTSVFTSPVSGVSRNVGIMLAGLLVGLHVVPAVVAFAHARYGKVLSRFGRGERWLLGTWALPSLAFFVLGHTGQLGYVLLVLPVGFLWLGAALERIDRASEAPRWPAALGTGARLRGWATARPVSRALTAMLLVSLVVHFGLPRAIYAIAASEVSASALGNGGPKPEATYFADHPAQSPLATVARQYSISDNDRYWGDMIEYIGGLDPDEVVVLTTTGGPLMSGSFRHLGYYLPEHLVYGMGMDSDGRFGQLFVSVDGTSTYSMKNMRHARSRLVLPASVRWIVIPDADLATRLTRTVPRARFELESGAAITAVPVGERRMLVFQGGKDRDVRISLVLPQHVLRGAVD